MAYNDSSSSSRRPRTSPSPKSSSGGFGRMFSSLKSRAAALVSPSPSPAFPSSSCQDSDVKSKRISQRPHTAPSKRTAYSHSSSTVASLRKHGLANNPRPPVIRTSRPSHEPRPSLSSTSSASSFTSAVSSFPPSSSSSSTSSSPSPSPTPSSSKRYNIHPDNVSPSHKLHDEQIMHLQDQISVLQCAVGSHLQRISVISEEDAAITISALDLHDSDSESTYSTDSVLSTPMDVFQPAKRSSVLLALYPSSSRPTTAEKKELYDPFAKGSIRVVPALPTIPSKGAVAKSRPSSGAFVVSNVPVFDQVIEHELLLSPDVPSLPPSIATEPGSRSSKRSSIATLGTSSNPPPVSALPLLPTVDDELYRERNGRHLTRKVMASESDAEADVPPPPPKTSREQATKDWTLTLGALEYYMDMHDPIDRPAHPAPPTLPPKETQVSSYLDMSTSSNVNSASASIRSARSRSKSRGRGEKISLATTPITHSPPLPQPEFDSFVYESPRPAPLPPPLSLTAALALPPSPAPSSRRTTPSPAPSSHSYATPSLCPSSHSSMRTRGHRQTASQSTVTSSMSSATVRSYHMPSNHAYVYPATNQHQHHHRSPSHLSNNSSIIYPTSSTTTQKIGKRTSRLLNISTRKEKDVSTSTSGWF
ncbi:hypothetical protein PLEOSDRAFT_1111179 [Pleurotus ostreatus PC15]|uniref:Uncharacterized protein n=2 Tax=Pleurotus TaxID=5320 RepID=A0A067P2J0_PLEO1|nr:hypothetical protein CCMSSC00406_0008952 [Pleurotus cornucopiae]KDQ30091.1 hypothetical protein PLEOSDRAFT_1111179 [Pleurotus ostreatus PC15]